MNVVNIDRKYLESKEITMTARLKSLQDKALMRFEEITGRNSIHSFHAMMGSNNNTYVDSVNSVFLDPNDFISRWLEGLTEKVKQRAKEKTLKPRVNFGVNREYFLMHALQDTILREYLFLFLARNFYRNFKERIRSKPDESLWSIWFGGGNLVWGLLISPEMRNDDWAIDKSEIRRSDFNFWTIRHVMKTGLIDPESKEPIKFNKPDDFIQFYRSVLKRVSNSLYEKAIAERYIEYLKKSLAPYEEPFLIPELRYAGKESKHKYRLDYTILNPYTMELVGFEISPASTHMSVPKIRDVKKVDMNRDLSEQWKKEMDKRNDYFSKFGITTITFTDEDLKDIDACFDIIAKYLSARGMPKNSLIGSLDKVNDLFGELSL
ncbi:topoisomerase II [Aeromonas veronii]|uniref:topoisomerase II n=1 Tax=Aeromonas TaxID=642 RepID=UPI00187FE763|nr:topoisomerase II [Aeromonas veronii]MBE8733840.1 topoisomerase II [Aeromonas veronii]MBE8738231.1 topoisomerase II [Aeromonas veronii]MBE8741826.1 topoisomerase II [Aeromonas veronii]MBE8763176.1 topoisomerase II [Aeromonas veronii]MBE8837788.1 topoisomerase II [Aeromonas veronii]